MQYYFYFLFPFLSLSSQATVKWLPDMSFDLPRNYKGGKLPCSKQTVVFPEILWEAVTIRSEQRLASMVLPINGDIFFEEGLVFGAGNETDCEEGNVYYTEKVSTSWAEAGVWSSSRFNKATPDAERIPCLDDIVEFPENVQSTVLLPVETQSVRGLKIGNKFYDTSEFLDLMYRGEESSLQFISKSQNLNPNVLINLKHCTAINGCPCQIYPFDIDCSTLICKVPSCVHPVKPIGNCCKICGGFVSFEISETFNIEKFKNLVEKIVNSYGNELEYHIGRLADNKVQLVIVEKAEYEGTSAQVLNEISYNLEEHWVQGAKSLQLSGSPLSKSGMGGKIVVSMFFLVIFTICTIYFYYYKIPNMRYPLLGRYLPNWFSRIQRRSDSVVSLTRRDSVITSTGVRTAFRNPLYDSRRGRVQVEESDTPH